MFTVRVKQQYNNNNASSSEKYVQSFKLIFQTLTTIDLVENTNSFSVFAITRNSSMLEKVVILSKIKIPYVKFNSLLIVSNEIVDCHFVPKIPTLRKHFYLFDKLP